MVAPTSVTVPSSITGRKPSCWARLKRWISSTKSSVPRPMRRRARASSKSFFRSATPVKIAEAATKSSLVAPASRRATVVLPVPGGPQKISEPGLPPDSRRVSAPSGPTRCPCPATSASVFGRSRSASGRSASGMTGSGVEAGAGSRPAEENRSLMAVPLPLISSPVKPGDGRTQPPSSELMIWPPRSIVTCQKSW